MHSNDHSDAYVPETPATANPSADSEAERPAERHHERQPGQGRFQRNNRGGNHRHGGNRHFKGEQHNGNVDRGDNGEDEPPVERSGEARVNPHLGTPMSLTELKKSPSRNCCRRPRRWELKTFPAPASRTSSSNS